MKKTDLSGFKPQSKEILAATPPSKTQKRVQDGKPVHLRMTIEERTKLEKSADKFGLQLAPFIRMILKQNGYI